MNNKYIAVTAIGIIMASLGLLWFLQGSDLVHIKPILCFADCEPISGMPLLWQVIGAATVLAGALVAYTGVRRLKR